MTTAKNSKPRAGQSFDLSKYQIQNVPIEKTVTIDETGESFNITVKQLSWSRRNQLISKCLNWSEGGKTSFSGDVYVRECLKEMILEAPWGKTTEAFLLSIDGRLGAALEALVPQAFGSDGNQLNPDDVKKGS